MPQRIGQMWNIGDVFTIPLVDGTMAIGQVLDIPIPNVASCAFYDYRVSPGDSLAGIELDDKHLIALLWTTPDLLDAAKWCVRDNRAEVVSPERWPNEEFRNAEWVGAKTYGSANIEKFMDAYHCLRTWDDWHDPEYLDKMLVSLEKKPANVISVRHP